MSKPYDIPEGGEAYIPMSPEQVKRNLAIWAEAMRRLDERDEENRS